MPNPTCSSKRRASGEPDATTTSGSSRCKRPRTGEAQQQPHATRRYNLRHQEPISYSNTCSRTRKTHRLRQRPPPSSSVSEAGIQTPQTSAATSPTTRYEPSLPSAPAASGLSTHLPALLCQPSPPAESPSPASYIPDEPPAEPNYPYDIQILDEPRPYEDLPWLRDFSCTLVREIQTTDSAAVLLVKLADSTLRVLKVFAPQPPEFDDPFSAEYYAYSALRHHGVCTAPPPPPRISATRRVVPFCYGALSLRSWRQIARVNAWKTAFRKTHALPLRALLLEYIPNAPSIMASPDRLAQRPELVDSVLDALRQVHSAGVLHDDALPRNMLIDDAGGVWWIDFGRSMTTAYCEIDRWWFQAEGWRVKVLLRDDVIPACREGRTPKWWIRGF
ncbi:hypothetical protein FN846DRAFT_949112 [Sphaerosporella brunnea]|uniref:Protein kinase domain-containing protein n=1 Tax=Sphaerosporella brunnea TaxID=1250544 RepID=A0A5J5EX45_9PEZI|nr:hypothetical protein FN846DRAFT_949112 [Sphaerosporella brunnea]